MRCKTKTVETITKSFGESDNMFIFPGKLDKSRMISSISLKNGKVSVDKKSDKNKNDVWNEIVAVIPGSFIVIIIILIMVTIIVLVVVFSLKANSNKSGSSDTSSDVIPDTTTLLTRSPNFDSNNSITYVNGYYKYSDKEKCVFNRQCASDKCSNYKCLISNGNVCTNNSDCADQNCVNGICKGKYNSVCLFNEDCEDGYCKTNFDIAEEYRTHGKCNIIEGTLIDKEKNDYLRSNKYLTQNKYGTIVLGNSNIRGTSCKNNSDCINGVCYNNICQGFSKENQYCNTSDDCSNGTLCFSEKNSNLCNGNEQCICGVRKNNVLLTSYGSCITGMSPDNSGKKCLNNNLMYCSNNNQCFSNSCIIDNYGISPNISAINTKNVELKSLLDGSFKINLKTDGFFNVKKVCYIPVVVDGNHCESYFILYTNGVIICYYYPRDYYQTNSNISVILDSMDENTLNNGNVQEKIIDICYDSGKIYYLLGNAFNQNSYSIRNSPVRISEFDNFYNDTHLVTNVVPYSGTNGNLYFYNFEEEFIKVKPVSLFVKNSKILVSDSEGKMYISVPQNTFNGIKYDGTEAIGTYWIPITDRKKNLILTDVNPSIKEDNNESFIVFGNNQNIKLFSFETGEIEYFASLEKIYNIKYIDIIDNIAYVLADDGSNNGIFIIIEKSGNYRTIPSYVKTSKNLEEKPYTFNPEKEIIIVGLGTCM